MRFLEAVLRSPHPPAAVAYDLDPLLEISVNYLSRLAGRWGGAGPTRHFLEACQRGGSRYRCLL